MVVTATIPRRGTPVRSMNLLRGAGEFLGAPGIALFLAGFTLCWAALAAVTAFYSIQVVALGGSPGLVGVAWAFGAAIEVPYMYAFPRVAGRFGTERIVVAGSIIFALRALLAALAWDPILLVVIAPLEGLGFASTFVGGVTIISARAPAAMQGTAQGLFSATIGLSTIMGSVIGGAIAGALGISRAVPVHGRRRPPRHGRHRRRPAPARHRADRPADPPHPDRLISRNGPRRRHRGPGR